MVADALAISASALQPVKKMKLKRFSIELVAAPSIFEARISIDPDRVEAILELSPPHSKKKLKSFFRKINFVQKIISRFAEIVYPLNDSLKKEAKP